MNKAYLIPIIIVCIILAFCNANAQYITTIAGTGTAGYSGDGGPAVLAELNQPYGIAVDTAGNLYVGDFQNYRVRKITPAGIISTIAGTGTVGTPGVINGVPATAVSFLGPHEVAVDRMGNVFFTDGDGCIYRVSPGGIVYTYAGTGGYGYSGDGGPATAAEFQSPWGIAVDSLENLYISDEYNYRIRKVNASGIITTIAGTGVAGYGGDGGPATAAILNDPGGIALDSHGNIFFEDDANFRIRKIDTNGIITTVAGTGMPGTTGDGGPATSAEIYNTGGLAIDKYGDIFISINASLNVVREIDTASYIATVVSFIASGVLGGFSGDGGLADSATMRSPWGLAVSKSGNLYIVDQYNERIREVTTRPFFTHGTLQSGTYCNGTINVDSLLAANDTNSGNTVTWGLVAGPYHGTASIADTLLSTGNLLVPSGLTYTPAAGFSGIDTLTAVVADGLITDTTTIYLIIQLPLSPGAITGPDTVCLGKSITLTDTTHGGTWTGSNFNAFVSSGSVTGSMSGLDTISYTVSNSCGAFAATYIVNVKDCDNAINNVSLSSGVSIYPNPGDGTFTLSFPSASPGQAQITVTNLLGEKVKEINSLTGAPVTVSLTAPPGIYFITINTDDGTYNTKIVVER